LRKGLGGWKNRGEDGVVCKTMVKIGGGNGVFWWFWWWFWVSLAGKTRGKEKGGG